MPVSRLIVLVAVGLVGLTCGLTPVAYATPADPSWISGLYDGADYDDVVFLVSSGAAAVTLSLPALLQSLDVVGIPRLASELVQTATVSAFQSRAPPA
jgi:hypothetical protein